jgi:hypothetical protein
VPLKTHRNIGLEHPSMSVMPVCISFSYVLSHVLYSGGSGVTPSGPVPSPPSSPHRNQCHDTFTIGPSSLLPRDLPVFPCLERKTYSGGGGDMRAVFTYHRSGEVGR